MNLSYKPMEGVEVYKATANFFKFLLGIIILYNFYLV